MTERKWIFVRAEIETGKLLLIIHENEAKTTDKSRVTVAATADFRKQRHKNTYGHIPKLL